MRGLNISVSHQLLCVLFRDFSFIKSAIVGSAIIKIIEKYGRNAAEPVGEYVKSMKKAVS